MLSIIRTASEVRAAVKALKLLSPVAFVPTMGALHDGHLELVRQAKQLAPCVVASIFVNPTQFAAHEDLSKYPRDEAGDLQKLESVHADLVYCPTEQDMYPKGTIAAQDPGGAAKVGLEDSFRPSHFAGVATVVARLFEHIPADIAFFGEKDYQQLQVIKQLVINHKLPIDIVGVPTVRAADGLALSSRNIYLSAEERKAAPALYRALRESAEAIRANRPVDDVLRAAREALMQTGFEVQYFELRDAHTLTHVTNPARPRRLLAAVKLGAVRLIDNVAV